MTSADQTAENSPILACTISRDVQLFDLLIEDMEATMGETWGDLGFTEALTFFKQDEASALEFVAIAMDESDEDQLGLIEEVIATAKEHDIKVILVTEDVTATTLHHLLRAGADEFLPYPLPEKELGAAIARTRLAPQPAAPHGQSDADAVQFVRPKAGRDGVIVPVHGLAGGTGASTLAVNLAWELANHPAEKPLRVCLLDLDLQFGTVATYLDLPRRETVHELLTDIPSMDDETFCSSLTTFNEKLHVLTAPPDILPLDYLAPEDVQRLIEIAQNNFDYVVIDMPTTVTQWTDTVLGAAHVYFATIELEMRSAQNTLRLKRALQAEDLPFDKLRFALNRAPKFTDLNGKSRIKRLAESLGISIELQLPDGGKPVVQACDHGLPLSVNAAKNPLRREIAKLAASIHNVNQTDTEAA